MKTFMIVITLWFPIPWESGPDAIQVDGHHGKPLRFETREACREHVEKNLEDLKQFAIVNFSDKPGALVKQILCAETK